MFKYAIPFTNIARFLSFMTSKAYITALFILLASICHAGPARPGYTTLTQPDGTSFQGKVRGDEFLKIITTSSGNAIIKDNDGWWCYATYDSNGYKSSTGHRVGYNVPLHIISASSTIPYETLSKRAAEKRTIMQIPGNRQLLSRMKAQKSLSDGTVQETTVKHGIVILAEYADVKFQYTKEDFVNLLTQEGYAVDGADGSAKEYFDSQFHGMFEFDFHVSEIVTLKGVRAYYGENDFDDSDKNPAEMIAEACKLADDDVDFSLYDDDNDGYVDNVFVFFAGEDEADNPENTECIWSHSWYITSGAGLDQLILDGKIIDQYACASELTVGKGITGIGTFCHEFSHTLGIPDFYDTDYEGSGGWASGLWIRTSLMDGGNANNEGNTPPYYNALEREITGLSDPILIKRNGTYTLEPIHEEGKYYRLNTDNPKEYYLFECRADEGWDKYIGGNGMLVYHVDRSSTRYWDYNMVNVRPLHQNADLIEADNRINTFTNETYISLVNNLNGIFFPLTNVTSLTAESTPGLKFWSGNKCEISITDIKRDGRNITFSVTGFEGEAPPTPVNIKTAAFMDAAIIRFESDRPYMEDAFVTWNLEGEEGTTVMISPYEEGKYSLTLEGLEPGNRTYRVSIHFESNGIPGEKASTSFMTSRTSPVRWPYIYLGKLTLDEGGMMAAGTEIALRVYNATLAEEVRWEYNNETIEAEGDGFFTINESGILRAYVYWADGSLDILEKKINISPSNEQ